MSLLLKALQNAAKNREAGAGGGQGQAPASPTGAASEGASELALEPIEHKRAEDALPRTERAAPQGAAPDLSGAADGTGDASRAQARNVLRAGAAKEPPMTTDRSGGAFGWLARRPLVAFSTAAGLFAIGYGAYLYLQITNPGIFMAQPSPVARPAVPPPPPAAVPVAPSPPAPVAVAPAEPPLTGVAPGAAPVAPSPPQSPAAGSPAPPAARAPSAPPTVGAAPARALAAAEPASATAPAAKPPAAGQPAAPVAGATAQPREPAPAAARAGATARPGPARTPTPAPAQPAPVVVPSDLTLAYQALQSGKFDEAERLYRQVLAGDTRSVDAMLGLASVHVHQNRAAVATQLYMRVLDIDPRNSHAQAGLLGLGGRADPVAAETRLKQLIAREPSAYLYFTLGNLYAEQNQWAAAQGAYFQAFNLAPDNPDYAFNLAVGLEHLSQPRLALDYYRRALALAQTRGNAQFALAPVQGRIRSLEAALSERP